MHCKVDKYDTSGNVDVQIYKYVELLQRKINTLWRKKAEIFALNCSFMQPRRVEGMNISSFITDCYTS